MDFSIIYNTSQCMKCGKCCEVIVLEFDKYSIKFKANDKFEQNTDFKFAARNFIQITEEQAFKINPYLKRWPQYKKYYYKCRKYCDRTKTCMVHPLRPTTCSLFPYYDHGITTTLYSENCVFKNLNIKEKI